eukprot:CAMPEP_0172576184 /NCGR_PEP_ID=MMETSP1067-20121228/137594_1 /TAXON_ID=265564 ORGANISM="Thalassiosira punctigera, Strain Tpunct2005C2" /NCGR_SAMPLE_ID=MMETSP1067 /ASSEMBLY_ACC=CAM_ASM_000444 /LENGTH=118 /DNA_ID=CAMNT_0013368847 /DNA_START=462 /DNA_END=815 /DNA_ORIENTATION=+
MLQSTAHRAKIGVQRLVPFADTVPTAMMRVGRPPRLDRTVLGAAVAILQRVADAVGAVSGTRGVAFAGAVEAVDAAVAVVVLPVRAVRLGGGGRPAVLLAAARVFPRAADPVAAAQDR